MDMSKEQDCVEEDGETTELSVQRNDNEPPKDQIVNVIGEIGWWQVEKSLIVFLVSIPGLAHIFLLPFLMPKVEFWCEDRIENGTTDTIAINNCSLTCTNFVFDNTDWMETIISEWDLVCEEAYLPVIAKMIFFSGFAVGTFVAGLVSDVWGRQRSIMVFSLLTLSSGVATSFMPNFPGFVVVWWLVSLI